MYELIELCARIVLQLLKFIRAHILNNILIFSTSKNNKY